MEKEKYLSEHKNDDFLPERKTHNLSKIASRYFIRASAEYPAFVYPQAAYIAKLCLSENYPKPYDLLFSLMGDDRELENIVIAGNARHAQSGKGPTSGEGIVVDLELDEMTPIIEADFRWAEVMINLPEETLTTILGMYAEFKERLIQSGVPQAAEEWYGKSVTSLLHEYFGEDNFAELQNWASKNEFSSDEVFFRA